MIVHRLDMATSGLLLVAKTKEVHQDLQAQCCKQKYQETLCGCAGWGDNKNREGDKANSRESYINSKGNCINKKKTAKAERTGNTGRIELPLCLNPLDRPRQMVSSEHGKEAITEYQIISESGKNYQ